MGTDIIFALVLTALFFGAITWLVIHSRLQRRGHARSEQQSPLNGRKVAETEAPRGAVTRRGAKR